LKKSEDIKPFLQFYIIFAKQTNPIQQMRKVFLLMVFICFAAISIKGQDYFINKAGDTVFCKITGITPKYLWYLNENRKVNILKTSITSYKYNNEVVHVGSKDYYSDELYNSKIIFKKDSLNNFQLAGLHLKKSMNRVLIGFGLTLGGSLLIIGYPQDFGLFVGSAVSLTGAVYYISSIFQIGKAGVYLMKAGEKNNTALMFQQTNSGLGLVLRF